MPRLARAQTKIVCKSMSHLKKRPSCTPMLMSSKGKFVKENFPKVPVRPKETVSNKPPIVRQPKRAPSTRQR